jgi:hypothetical protein
VHGVAAHAAAPASKCTLWPVCGAAGAKAKAAVVAGAAATLTLCSTVAVWPVASVTVRVTYFVPAPWKLKSIVCPLPRGQLPPDGGSSAHEYVQGADAHAELLPSKWTDWPVTGLAGDELNAAVVAVGGVVAPV